MISVISRASSNSVKCNPPRSITAIPQLLPLPTLSNSSPAPHFISTLSTRPSLKSMSSPPYSTSSSSSAAPTPTTSVRSMSPHSSISSAPSMHTSNKRVSLSGRHNLNPLSFVDTTAIDAQMKLASLNHHAGYSTKSYPAAITQPASTEYTPEYMAKGYQVLREPAWNKGESGINSMTFNTQLTLDRHFIYPGRESKEEPHRPHSTCHGEYGYAGPACHEND